MPLRTKAIVIKPAPGIPAQVDDAMIANNAIWITKNGVKATP